MSEQETHLQAIIESALLVAGEPLSIKRLAELFAEEACPSEQEIRAALTAIQTNALGRCYRLQELASGFCLQIKPEYAPWVARLWQMKPPRYSRALLETLAIIAYRQPVTRAEIEDIRGVAVSSHIIKTLLEREWIRVIGHRQVPGKPGIYGTTNQFLDYFNLKSLDELPTLSELSDLDSYADALASEHTEPIAVPIGSDEVASET